MFLKNVSFGPPFEISIEFRQKSLKNYDFCWKKFLNKIFGEKLSIKSDEFTPPNEIKKFSELAPPPGASYLVKPCLELIYFIFKLFFN
jgi:hypothetical protein